MPNTHRGTPTGDNHRPYPRLHSLITQSLNKSGMTRYMPAEEQANIYVNELDKAKKGYYGNDDESHPRHMRSIIKTIIKGSEAPSDEGHEDRYLDSMWEDQAERGMY